MSWIAIALISNSVFSVVSVLDKRILAAHVKGVRGFYVVVGLLQYAMAVSAFLVVPWRGGSTASVAMAAASGGMAGVSLLAYFYSLSKVDASRAVPVFHTFPAFVALISVGFLGERLAVVHWAAILVVVAGAGLVAAGQPKGTESENQWVPFGLLVVASLAIAGSTVTSKVALGQMDSWNVFALRSALMGTILASSALRPAGFRDAVAVLRDRRATALVVLTEGILVAIAVYTMLVALSLGSAALVATVMATRPVVVLFLSALLSTRTFRLLEEPLTRDAWGLKLVSTGMVALGVAALALA